MAQVACIITHGNLAQSIKEVSEKLIPPAIDIHCYSNQELSLEVIEERIARIIEQQEADKVLLFTDLVGGSCWLAANRLKHRFPQSVVLGGVNVPMLISLHMNLPRLSWQELIEKIVADAKKGVVAR